MFVVALDIGGTKIIASRMRLSNTAKPKILKKIEQPTSIKSSGAANQLTGLVEELLENKNPPRAIAVAVPGPLDRKRGLILKAPNLPGWENLPVKDLLEKKFRTPVLIENDANAAALAEALWGAGQGKRFVLFATISTGIGTGLVIDGRLYLGSTGMALEGGHLTIDHKGPLCGCGARGCIEAYASGPAIVRQAKKILPGAPPELSPRDIKERARQGDPACQELIEETAKRLGLWLGSIVNLLDPDIIVLGGGITNFGKPLFSTIRRTLPLCSINPKAGNIPVKRARLGREMGIFGAAALTLNQGPSNKET